jgi:hypothetical protein
MVKETMVLNGQSKGTNCRLLCGGLGVLLLLLANCGKKNGDLADRLNLPSQGDSTPSGKDNGDSFIDNADPSAGIAAAGADESASLLDSKFQIKIKTLGIPVCSGSLRMKFNSTAEDSADIFSITEGTNSCITDKNHPVDVGKLMKPMRGINLKQPGVQVKNGVIYVGRMGNSIFTPARPLMPSFITETTNSLRNIKSEKLAVSFENAVTGEKGQGTSELVVTSVNAPFHAPIINRTFNEVIVFVIKNTGFQTEQLLSNMLFEEMTFTYSLSPIMLLRLELKGPTSKLLEESSSGASGQNMVTKALNSNFMQAFTQYIPIQMTLDLMEMKGVDAQTFEAPTKRTTTQTLDETPPPAP